MFERVKQWFRPPVIIVEAPAATWMSIAEIAERTNLTVGAARHRVHQLDWEFRILERPGIGGRPAHEYLVPFDGITTITLMRSRQTFPKDEAAEEQPAPLPAAAPAVIETKPVVSVTVAEGAAPTAKAVQTDLFTAGGAREVLNGTIDDLPIHQRIAKARDHKRRADWHYAQAKRAQTSIEAETGRSFSFAK